MVEQRFYIAENRLDEFKLFIRTKTPTLRFKHNPLMEFNQWYIVVEMEVNDAYKLDELFNKWHSEDNPPKPTKTNFFNKLINLFR